MRHRQSSRIQVTVLGALALAFVVAAPARAAENDMGWGGFGVGTMIHLKSTQNVAVPGMAPRKIVTETKKTLLRIADDAFVLKIEEKAGGAWSSKEVTVPKLESAGELAHLLPHAMGTSLKPEELGKESVTVDGKSYECRKMKVTIASGPMGNMSSTIWEHPEHGTLKMTSTGTAGMSMEVTKLDQPVKVGDVTLTCKASTMTQGAAGMTMKRLESTDVPEGMVRSEVAMKQGPMQTSTVEELVAFVKK